MSQMTTMHSRIPATRKPKGSINVQKTIRTTICTSAAPKRIATRPVKPGKNIVLCGKEINQVNENISVTNSQRPLGQSVMNAKINGEIIHKHTDTQTDTTGQTDTQPNRQTDTHSDNNQTAPESPSGNIHGQPLDSDSDSDSSSSSSSSSSSASSDTDNMKPNGKRGGEEMDIPVSKTMRSTISAKLEEKILQAKKAKNPDFKPTEFVAGTESLDFVCRARTTAKPHQLPTPEEAPLLTLRYRTNY